MKMTQLELQGYATKWLRENFDLGLAIPIKINSRLQRTLGWFRHTRSVAIEIELSKKLLTYYEIDEIKDVLHHELIHYALFTLRKPYKDGDRFFEQTLQIFGVTRTGVYKHHGKIYEYRCSCKTHEMRRQLNLNRGYICKSCQAKLSFVGEKIV